MPDLLPENVPAWRLWCRVNTQWRMGFDGPVGLDYNALHTVAEIYGLEITPALFEKIRELEYYTMKKTQEKAAK
ncbi:MAG: DUF1799 domain-containing protein [Negativicutes bacterium]|nr:DUF1799 domain-containing protein [Negativicutes bacterium]